MAPLALIFVVFYIFLIRPQQKKAKETRAMLDAIRRGDRVVTGGGIIGTVAKVRATTRCRSTSPRTCGCASLRATITSVLAKPVPASAKDDQRRPGRQGIPEPAAAGEEA